MTRIRRAGEKLFCGKEKPQNKIFVRLSRAVVNGLCLFLRATHNHTGRGCGIVATTCKSRVSHSRDESVGTEQGKVPERNALVVKQSQILMVMNQQTSVSRT